MRWVRDGLHILLVLVYQASYFTAGSKSDTLSLNPIYRRPELKTVFWMHIQKTSSWIGDLLAVWACPEFCNTVIADVKKGGMVATTRPPLPIHVRLGTPTHVHQLSIPGIKVHVRPDIIRSQQESSHNSERDASIPSATADHNRLLENQLDIIEEANSDEVPLEDIGDEGREYLRRMAVSSDWDGENDYFNMFDRYLTNHNILQRGTAMTKSVLMNCSVKFDGYDSGVGWHLPYDNKLMKGTIITMLRDPTNRIISAFLFDVMIPIGFPVHSNEKRQEVKDNILKSEIPIQAYVNLPGISSCQTKMILGHYCGATVPLSEKLLLEAKRRLREDFYFIGLTEESMASANLFLAMHHVDGGKRFLTTPTIDDLRHPTFKFTSLRQNSKHDVDTHMKHLLELKNIGWNDTFDEEIYAEGKRIFYERCAQYNITTTRPYITESNIATALRLL